MFMRQPESVATTACAPDFSIAAEFGAIPSFDLDIAATMEFDLTLHKDFAAANPPYASVGCYW